MLGLALQGGGAKGAFQVGAIKALNEEGYIFDGVVGTSIGALNAALVAQGDFEKTYELWYNIEVSQLYDFDDKMFENLMNLNIDSHTIKYLLRKIKDVITDKGINRVKARKLMSSYLNEEKLRASKMDLGLVIVENKKIPQMLFKEDIPKGQLVDYIIASGNLPIFNDLNVGDKKIYDGGLYDNLPINMLINKGYKDIIAIRLGDTVSPIQKVTDKTVRITYIDPSEKPGSLLNFTNKSVRRALILGYFDTLKVIKGYVGKKYYIHPVNENEFYRVIENLSYSFFNECASILDISIPKNKTVASQLIIDEIRDLMKLNRNCSDIYCLTCYVEAFAEFSKVVRFKVYSLSELLNRTITEFIKIKTNKKISKRLEKLVNIFNAFIKARKEIDMDDVYMQALLGKLENKDD